MLNRTRIRMTSDKDTIELIKLYATQQPELISIESEKEIFDPTVNPFDLETATQIIAIALAAKEFVEFFYNIIKKKKPNKEIKITIQSSDKTATIETNRMDNSVIKELLNNFFGIDKVK